MQGARVKRVLTPVHDVLYQYLSRSKWLVKGELSKSHILPIVADIREGESFVSGDYKSATDNIHLPAVLAIVDVLCEAVHLTQDEKDILRASFTDLKRVSLSGKTHDILQGSMMGNLCSFPLLCLLNKACHDIFRDFRNGRRRGKSDRKVRCNGDDILFAGDSTDYALWREVTGHYGLIVNEEKTGFSRRWLELNSRSYDTRKNRFVGKPVLSFLRRTNLPGNLLSEVVKGCATLSHRVFWYVVNVVMRQEISHREISLDIPNWVLTGLLKKLWFRKALQRGPLPCKQTGEDRCYPTTIGPVPDPAFYPHIERAEEVSRRFFVKKWRGVAAAPLERVIRRDLLRRHHAAFESVPFKDPYILVQETEWAFLWPSEVLSFVRESHPEVLIPSDKDEWWDDHPRLITKRRFTSRPRHRIAVGPPQCLLASVNIGGVINYPNGLC